MNEEPLYPTAIIGYREWRIYEGRLYPLGMAGHRHWEPGLNRAICLREREHAAPECECECGLYAYHGTERLRTDLSNGHFAAGAVLARGRAEVHATGFRAEAMQILALYLPRLCSSAEKEAVYAAARNYGVPVVRSLRALRRLAHGFGEPAPQELRPTYPRQPRAYRLRRFLYRLRDMGPTFAATALCSFLAGHLLAELIGVSGWALSSILAAACLLAWAAPVIPGDRLSRLHFALALNWLLAASALGALSTGWA